MSQSEQNRQLTQQVNKLKSQVSQMQEKLIHKDAMIANMSANIESELHMITENTRTQDLLDPILTQSSHLEQMEAQQHKHFNHILAPSAPPDEDGLDSIRRGMTLSERLTQRPSWKEIYSRGILINDPRIAGSLQKSQQQLHRRRASIKLDHFLPSRPSKDDLEKRNIMLSDGETIETIKDRRRRTSILLNEQIQQRPNPNQIGLIVDLDGMEYSANKLNYTSQQAAKSPPIREEENNHDEHRRGRPSIELADGYAKAIYDENGAPMSKAPQNESRRRGRESREIVDTTQIWAQDALNDMTSDDGMYYVLSF